MRKMRRTVDGYVRRYRWRDRAWRLAIQQSRRGEGTAERRSFSRYPERPAHSNSGGTCTDGTCAGPRPGLNRASGGFRKADQADPRGQLPRVPLRGQTQGRLVACRIRRRARWRAQRRGRPARLRCQQLAPRARQGRSGRSDAARRAPVERRRNRDAQAVGRSGRAADAVLATCPGAVGGPAHAHRACDPGGRLGLGGTGPPIDSSPPTSRRPRFPSHA